MKIILRKEFGEDGEESQKMFIEVGGVGEQLIWKSRDLAQDCPEDATLSRSMTNGEQIISLMQKAHYAGSQGEPLTWDIQ